MCAITAPAKIENTFAVFLVITGPILLFLVILLLSADYLGLQVIVYLIYSSDCCAIQYFSLEFSIQYLSAIYSYKVEYFSWSYNVFNTVQIPIYDVIESVTVIESRSLVVLSRLSGSETEIYKPQTIYIIQGKYQHRDTTMQISKLLCSSL